MNDSLRIPSVWNVTNLCEIDFVWIRVSNLGTSKDFDRLNIGTLMTQFSCNTIMWLRIKAPLAFINNIAV